MTGQVTADEEQWADEAIEARHKSLDNVRATGKAWTESIGLILGAFTTAAFLKGPEALTDIPADGFTLQAGPWTYEPAPTVVNLVFIGALTLAVAFLLGALAAQGTPKWEGQLTGRRYASGSAAAAKASIRNLSLSRLATVVAALLIVTAMAMAWTAQLYKPDASKATSAIASAGGQPICGTLTTSAGGALTIAPKGGAPSAVDAAMPVTIVESCP
jgi:hypothetical protein